MTNILQIPQIDGPATAFSVANNSNWVDQLYFSQLGFPPTIALSSCALVAGSNVITVPAVGSLQVGMTINPVPGLLSNGGYVGSISSITQITCVDSYGNPVNAEASTISGYLIFTAPPLDLTGIDFLVNLRLAVSSARIWLTAQTFDGTMSNQGPSGIVAFNVPLSTMQKLPAGAYILDLLAIADGYTINLMQNGPASVTITYGVSDPATAAI